MKTKKLQPLVMEILAKDKKARNDDGYLYVKVCKKLNAPKAMNWDEYFLRGINENGLPTIESVARMRRLIQSTEPSLRANSTVRAYREAQRRKYLSIAIS